MKGNFHVPFLGGWTAVMRVRLPDMKDLLMELYDCPDYSDKETQAGVNIVENAALSILGVTTAAGLSTAVSDADWANGLLVRFALLTQMDRGGEAITERRQQDALLNAIRRAGEDGSNLRSLYRALHLTAQRTRQLAQDLVRAGLVVEQRLKGAEWYVAVEHTH